jgi:hypothetical protein
MAFPFGGEQSDQPIRQIANRINAATIPRKQTVHSPVRHDCCRIKSVRSCRVAAITMEDATKTGKIQRRYSKEIAIIARVEIP